MKHSNSFYLIYISILVLLVFSGCKKYLDLKPKGVDIATTVEHYNGLFNNISLGSYNTNTVNEDGSFMLGAPANMAAVMGDEVIIAAPFSNVLEVRTQNAYKWLADIYQPTEDAPEWASFYLANYTYNVIAGGIKEASGGTEQQKKELLAEARTCRALMHFMVLNYFSKPYNSATAATDPGVPLITRPDAPALNNKRASVKDVYDFILTELKVAVPDLPERTVSRFRLAGAGGNFILGQVCFNMKNYEEALIYLNESKRLLSNSNIPLNLYNYNVKMNDWKPFFSGFSLSMPPANTNEETIFQKQVSTQSNIFLNPAYKTIFTTDDERLKFYITQGPGGTPNYPYPMRNSPFSINFGPSVPNLYLMLAECKARTNDISGAVSDLETLRRNRMPATTAAVTITDKNELISFIVEERLREYACTGMRWFDIRRLWDDPLFSGKTYSHITTDGTIQLTKDRLALKVPPKIKSYNPEMDVNP